VRWNRAQWLWVIAGLLLAGCDATPTDEPYGPLSLFDDELRLVVILTPATPDNGDTLSLELLALPTVTGRGGCSLNALGDGLGDALEPVAGELGFLATDLDFTADDSARIDWRIAIDTPSNLVAVECWIWFDSLLVEGHMVGVQSPAAHRVYGDLIEAMPRTTHVPVLHPAP